MKSGAAIIMPARLKKSLKKLGRDINTARQKQNLSIADAAERAGIAGTTLRRLEAGNPSVSIASLAMVLFALGKHHRLDHLINIKEYDAGC